MLHLVLTTLLAMQDASASPGAVGAPEASDAAEQVTPRETTPTPGPRRSPTPQPKRSPTPKAAGDLLIVVNKTDNSVSLLDAATGKTRSTVAVEKGSHEAEVLADGKTLAVSGYGRSKEPGRYVTFIDLSTGKVTSRLDIGEGSRPHGLKALSDGRLLVTAEGKRELAVVNPVSGKVATRISTGRDVSHMVAASPDGRRAYVSSLSNGVVTVIDLASGKVLQNVATGKGAEGIDVTPDGREIWVANRAANTISVIEAKTLKVVFTIRANEFPIRVKMTPDGTRALVAFTGSGDIGVFDVATRTESKRIPIGRDAVSGTEDRVFAKRFGTSPAPVGIWIAPDGKRAWVAATHADVIAVIDLEKLRVDDAWTAGREPDGLAGRFQNK
jgi:YVTN family beta-propeller protein